MIQESFWILSAVLSRLHVIYYAFTTVPVDTVISMVRFQKDQFTWYCIVM